MGGTDKALRLMQRRGATVLGARVAVYVPSADQHGRLVRSDRRAAWVRTCTERFATWYGGATVYKASGAGGGADGLVYESVDIVTANAGDSDILGHAAQLWDLAIDMGRSLSQESVAVELGGVLVLIRPAGVRSELPVMGG